MVEDWDAVNTMVIIRTDKSISTILIPTIPLRIISQQIRIKILDSRVIKPNHIIDPTIRIQLNFIRIKSLQPDPKIAIRPTPKPKEICENNS